MSESIRLLPDSVIAKIAAGEVVDRPSSVVKELLENSLDAGATRIRIAVEDGGKRNITVTDDGCGIPAHEVRLALLKHATNKISTFEDLSSVRTMGFRGEALSSIAAVSRLDLLTRTADAPVGVRIQSNGGEIGVNEPIGTSPGTTVSVSHLFFNVPARIKFLKSRATELGHIDSVVRRISMAELNKDILFESEGETVLHLPGATNLTERATQLFGRSVSTRLRTFSGEQGAIHVHGLVSDPDLNFSRPDEVFLFVNGRVVRDRMLPIAVLEGFRTALMERRYPMAIVFVELPGDRVDVNVHPAKTEVKFSDSQAVFRLVSESIARAVRPKEGQRLPSPVMASEMSVEYTTSVVRPLPQMSLSEVDVGVDAQGTFSSLDYLGSIDRTYLVCRSADSMVVIDQHAAHERVKFEELRRALTLNDRGPAQALLVPLTMQVTSAEKAVLAGQAEAFSLLGFEIEEFGPDTIVIKAVPPTLGRSDPRVLLKELATDEFGSEWRDHRDAILSRIACHSAVRAHDEIGRDQIRALLSSMDRIDLATHCPHGRPTHVTFDVAKLEHLFSRR